MNPSRHRDESEIPPGLPSDPEQTFKPGALEPARDDAPPDAGELPTLGPESSGPMPVSNGSAALWSIAFDPGIEEVADVEEPEEPGGDAPIAYRFHRPVGRGGFGEVWEATQTSLGRIVAVKRLREDRGGGAATGSNRARQRMLRAAFRQEAITAANLEHPNIVPIHDLGIDEEGRPVLAMKLVRGTPWDELLAREVHATSPAEFLGRHLPILIDVAQAVAFAHSRGIVHRDLKPAQVMVGEFDEVLLMDWGLAVVYDPESLAAAIRHQHDAPIAPQTADATSPAGTPALMAPEQTRTTAADIGPWTDIYLLGGTLYYLLTGSYPHQSSDSHESFRRAYGGMVEVPEHRAPDREIPEELSRLAMRALAPRSGDRPASVREFIQALKDYLTGATRRRESMALTATATQRLDRAAGNYREYGECSTLLSNALALWRENPHVPPLSRRVFAEHARAAIANGDLVLARVMAGRLDEDAVRAPLDADLAAAERRIRRSRSQRTAALVASFLFLLALIAGAAFYARDLRIERDRANEALADARMARNAAMAARAKAEERRARVEGLMNYLLVDVRESLLPVGRLEPLELIARSSVEYFESLPEEEYTPESLRQRGLAENNLGDVLKDQGNITAAEQNYRAALDIRRRLVERDPANTQWRRDLALTVVDLGRIDLDRGDGRAAHARFLEALTAQEEIDAAESGNLQLQREIAASLHMLALAKTRIGETTEALALYDRSLAIRERLAAEFDHDASLQRDIAGTHNNVGLIAIDFENLELAFESFTKAHAIRESQALASPENLQLQRDYAWNLCNIGLIHRHRGDLAASLAAYRHALEIRLRLGALDPRNAEWRRDIAVSHELLGGVLILDGDAQGALDAYRAARPVWLALVAENPDNPRWQSHELANRVGVVRLLQMSGDTAGAIDEMEGMIPLLESQLEPSAPAGALNVNAWRRVELGRLCAELGQAERAAGHWRRAVEIIEPATAKMETAPVEFLDTHVQALLELRRVEDARPIAEFLLAQDWDEPDFLRLCRENGLLPPLPSYLEPTSDAPTSEAPMSGARTSDTPTSATATSGVPAPFEEIP